MIASSLSLQLLVILCRVVLNAAGQKNCRSVSSINDYTLAGHAYLSIIGKKLMTCVITCDHDSNCYSLNYKFPTSTCELNGETRVSHPGHFLHTPDSVYVEHLSRPFGSCSGDFPCKHLGRCVNIPRTPGFRCFCQEDYVGEFCQDCSSPPLGISDGHIPDSQITGSSNGQWLLTIFKPYMGRLHGPSSWVISLIDTAPFLQIDLSPKTRLITHVATQGSPKYDWWTTSYVVRYKDDGDNWLDYKENRRIKDFQANSDKNSVVQHSFNPPFQARYVRIVPTQASTRTAIRVELYGCTVF